MDPEGEMYHLPDGEKAAVGNGDGSACMGCH